MDRGRLPRRCALQNPSSRTPGFLGRHCTVRICFSGSPSTITFRSQAGNFACQPFELVCLCHETDFDWVIGCAGQIQRRNVDLI